MIYRCLQNIVTLVFSSGALEAARTAGPLFYRGELRPALQPALSLYFAIALGQIVGQYGTGAGTAGFVATPTAEPSCLSLMGVGMGVDGRRHQRAGTSLSKILENSEECARSSRRDMC
jgi:hypothetical protein